MIGVWGDRRVGILITDINTAVPPRGVCYQPLTILEEICGSRSILAVVEGFRVALLNVLLSRGRNQPQFSDLAALALLPLSSFAPAMARRARGHACVMDEKPGRGVVYLTSVDCSACKPALGRTSPADGGSHGCTSQQSKRR